MVGWAARRGWALGLALGLAPGSALAPLAAAPTQSLSQERLVAPRLPGFVIGHYRTDAEQTIREEVPRGETVRTWTRMVTTQRFAGLAAKASPEVYARNTLAGIPDACPGARVSPIRSLRVSGHAAAQVQVDCPINPAAEGKPETFILLAVAGLRDMHVKQVAFRGGTTRQHLAWAQGFLSGVAFCAPDDKAPACMG